MQGKSNSFIQVSPFIPRSGILASSYIAFPLDTLIPSGCLFVNPQENFIGNKGGCSYAIPASMADGDVFFKGFSGSDYSDPLWVSPFNDSLPAQNPGYDQHSGNMFMTEDGKKIVVWGDGVLVLTREDDDSFSAVQVNGNGGSVGIQYTMSRDYILAGSVDGQGALWLDGPEMPPTIDSNISDWQWISPDGTKVYGTTTGGDVIERTIDGNVDVILETGTGGTFACVDFCNETAVVNSSDFVLLYRKIDGVWTNTATFADDSGDPSVYPSVTIISGKGKVGFGGRISDNSKVLMWDLNATGTLTGVSMNLPGDQAPFTDANITGMASDGSIVVGYYVTNELHGSALYWLKCDNYSTARNLDDYLTAQGITNLGFDTGEYSSIDTVVCSANGRHFVARANKEPIERSMYYAAVPAPTCFD